MRISELFSREPFDAIAEQTLKRFWEAQYNQLVQVTWQSGYPGANSTVSNSQRWLCNFYLNAIFRPGASNFIFAPVHKEFSRSRSFWKRPLQKTYVLLASNKYTSSWFAHAYLDVFPPIQDSMGLLIVAGNHKIRILDRYNGLTYAVIKSGSSVEFMQSELKTRQEAAQVGIPVPELYSVASDETWFVEEYVIGTPLNRLADERQKEKLLLDSVKSLTALTHKTLKEQSLVAYLKDLTAKIAQRLQENVLLLDEIKKTASRNVQILTEQVNKMQLELGETILISIAHGDFHPANILQMDSSFVIIDWEYSGYRQVAYDPLVFTLQTRFPEKLAQRIRKFVESTPKLSAFHLAKWPGLDWESYKQRMLQVNLLLLEELNLNLGENTNPVFFAPGKGLTALLQEITEWTESLDNLSEKSYGTKASG
ncbi:MAG TPA: aminoglycoside phosphotransferase family protein [Cyclobacteriaceae bacterium]|nr:aminoglycoside phosphotransferase family protein [Cyclobacteriaceae bacterium]